MKPITFLLVLIFVLSGIIAEGQDFIKNSSVSGVCYAGKNPKKVYIPPPSQFLKKGAKAGGTITVYYSGFPPPAITAFEYAVSILESVLPADTKMTIRAYWELLTDDDVLGNTVVTGFAAGWGIDAADPIAYYPVALAEKIYGQSLNTDVGGDFELRINSSVDWYLGTDGKALAKYDLVTVVLHETCHGLGFFDSMNTDEAVGSYLSPVPMVYDHFVENQAGHKLTDTLRFSNFSASLRSQLIGGQLYFNGPMVRSLPGAERVKLHAPPQWDNGSSVSHIDEDEYTTPQEYQLMTPFIDPGEAIHNPGKVIMSMLGDLGWVNTRIKHEPTGDTEEALSEVTLSVEVVSDTTYNRDRVGVVFSYDGFDSIDTMYLNSPNSDNFFRTTINIPSYNTDLQYYFFVEDYFHRIFKSPSLIEVFRFGSYIGTDTVDPLMSHVPVEYCLQTADTVSFRALVADNLGIDTVYMEYIVNEGQPEFMGFTSGEGNVYTAFIELKRLNLTGGDSVRYRIIARDIALIANIKTLPAANYYSFTVERIEAVVESYSTDFSNAIPDFFNIGFDISRPSGFSSFGLHSKHPYESPEANNESIEYIALLRHPVKFDDSGLLISFDEIVLVEPGEDGSLYGSSDFYDYVVVEASKNSGRTWFDLAAGYDSRHFSSWEDSYNNYITGQNSTYVGTESMLRKHVIYYRPSDILAAGDTVLVRFRLFSDPFAYGWGWVIQDLKLNALINSAGQNKVEPVVAYPNPGSGIIRLGGVSESKPFRYSVFNSSGSIIVKDKLSDGSGIIDLSSNPTGLYIIVLSLDDGVRTIRYSLIR